MDKKIFVIGDSHCKFGWQNIIFNWLRGRTCYRFGKKNLQDFNIRHLVQDCGLWNGDIIIFTVGEVDCRCHVHKHISPSRSYKDVIDDLIINYMETVKLLVSDVGLSLYVYIYNIVPPRKSSYDPERPIMACKEDRLKFVKYFNSKLKEECKKNGFGFFDIYDKYADEEGYLIYEFSDGFHHIENGKYIMEFINQNIKKQIDSGEIKLTR